MFFPPLFDTFSSRFGMRQDGGQTEKSRATKLKMVRDIFGLPESIGLVLFSVHHDLLS